MNQSEIKNENISVEEMQKEIRTLKRKLALAEANLTRSTLILEAQNRSENIMNNSFKKELQFFKLVLENTNNILLLLDFDGRFAYASTTFLNYANVGSMGLINGHHFKDVLAPLISSKCLEQFSETIELAISNKDTVVLEQRMSFNHSPTRLFSILVTPMTDHKNDIIGIMALFNDITEINDALNAANRASIAKTQFLANMSHEIRTPLNAVIGMTSIAQSSDDMDKIRYCLDKINDSSAHLLGVINDILDMSKIETNHFELSSQEFVFEKMLLRLVDVMRFKIEEKNIYFTLHCDPGIPYAISSDEQRLSQVIMNLLSNAIKFTPANGSVEIRVTVDEHVGDSYRLRFEVKDTGIGISEDQRPRLFKAFSQADNSISRKFGGTGLGLTISQRIVNLLGGDITFESQEGKGTNFIFTIVTRACQIEPIVKINRENVRILVVDDMQDIRSSFAFYSQKLGITCHTADGANQALEILKTEKFDIIFVDWKMPEIDGLTFVKLIDETIGSQIIVIMISAADWSEIEKDAKAVGVKEFISKPILLPVIENILDKYCDDIARIEAHAIDDFSKKTILLVDDIDINREIIISLLEHTGVNIVCAENGKEALDIFINSDTRFDLIFMDIHMPIMDGYEATRQIRASNTFDAKSVPIVAMTANVFKEDVERCLKAGMNDHVGKPVNIDEIIVKIKQWTIKTNK